MDSKRLFFKYHIYMKKQSFRLKYYVLSHLTQSWDIFKNKDDDNDCQL